MIPRTNSELACFQVCERKHHYSYTLRREGLVPVESLTRGRRMHEWLAGWWGCVNFTLDHTVPAVERAMLAGYQALYQRPHLRNVRVNVPFRVSIVGVEMVGECDAIGEDDDGLVVVEHKTTTGDISPGSSWWQESAISSQDTLYLAAFPGARLLKDVLRVPGMKPLQANRKRKVPETDDEYIARVLADMVKEPGKYFQRAVMVRTKAEQEAYAFDVLAIHARITRSALPYDGYVDHPRNPRSCFAYGRRCEFFDACWNGKAIEEYPVREMNHSEEVASRADTQR